MKNFIQYFINYEQEFKGHISRLKKHKLKEFVGENLLLTILLFYVLKDNEKLEQL